MDDPASVSAWLDRVAVRAAEVLATGDASAASDLKHAVEEVGMRLQAGPRLRSQGIADVLQSAIGSEPQQPATALEQTTVASRMLHQLLETPHVTNRHLAALLDVDETQVSRAGRRLRTSGFAVRRKIGRTNRWVVTDKGRRALGEKTSEPVPDAADETVDSALNERLGAMDSQTATRSADALARLGVAQRSSVLTRGSLVRVAEARLSEEDESELLQLLPEDVTAWTDSLLAVLGEWGSAETVRELTSRVSPGLLRREALAVALTGALRKLGGIEATQALARILEDASGAGGASGHVLRAGLAAVEELITGGGGDATEGAASPQTSERWRPDDPAQARAALHRLAEVLTRASLTADSPYLRQAAAKNKDLLASWARANALTPGLGGTADVPRPGGADDGTYALVIDIGHRTMRVGIGDRDGHVIDVSTAAFENLVDKEASQTIQRAAALARELLHRNRTLMGTEDVRTLVIGVPGPISPVDGTLISTPQKFPYMVDWEGFPVAERATAVFEEALGWSPRVVVDNDANLGVLGEVTYGKARGCSNAIYVKVSTGVGAGLYLHGRLYRGLSGLAGEFGHFPVGDYPSEYTGRERRARPPSCVRCHQESCLEVLASAESVLERIAVTSSLRPSSAEEVISQVATESVYAAAVSRAGMFLGVALSGLMSLLDPEVVLLGGLLSRAGEPFLGAVRRSVDERAGALSQRVLVADHPELAGLVGGLSLAFRVPATVPSAR